MTASLLCKHPGCGKPLTRYVEDVIAVRKIRSLIRWLHGSRERLRGCRRREAVDASCEVRSQYQQNNGRSSMKFRSLLEAAHSG